MEIICCCCSAYYGLAPKLNIHDWRVLFGGMGVVLSISAFALLLSGMYRVNTELVHPEVFLWSLGLGTGLITLIYGVNRYYLGFSLMTNKLNAIIIWAHILNILSIYVWLDTIFHKPVFDFLPASAFIQIGEYDWRYLILPILWILNTKFRNSDNIRYLLKFIILSIGLDPAMRNILRMVLGV